MKTSVPEEHRSTPPRCGNIDISRWIAAVLIMIWHANLIIPIQNNYWAWVEYFFILSGYFTMAHFARNPSARQSAKDILKYVFQRFIKFMPYVVCAVVAQYLVNAVPLLLDGHPVLFVRSFFTMPYELLLLSSSGITSASLPSIWYLSAMFIAMPLFCWLLVRYRDSWPIWALLIPILYYGKFGVNVVRTPMNDMLRAFVGMTLGSAVYYIVELLRRKRFKCSAIRAFTILEVLSFAASIFITTGKRSYLNLLLITFVIHASLGLSCITATSRIQGRWCSLLAKLSLPMYLFHLVVLTPLNHASCSPIAGILLYFGITIAISFALLIAVEHCKAALRRKKPRA